MTQYAFYDSSQVTSQVTGWYDTGAFTYTTLPPANNLFQLTPEQWAEHFQNPSGWAVFSTPDTNPSLIPYVPPPLVLTLPQQAAQLLNLGITLTCTSTPSLNGQYACDAQATQFIQAEMISIFASNKFADGATTLDWPDVSGTIHTFPNTDEFKFFSIAVGNFVSACQKVINGSSTTLPSPLYTIA